MATITDTTTDANGNIIINVSSSADDAITLATAGTYSDKNIIFNITNPQNSVQPDWNQNNDTQPDYIKNRPFYTVDPVETVLVEESVVAFEYVGEGLYAGYFELTFVPIIGETYKVYWDGTTYECTCADFSGRTTIGNLPIGFPGASSDTGEPFIMDLDNGLEVSVATRDTSASHTISISVVTPPVVKVDPKLNEYVDSMIDAAVPKLDTTLSIAGKSADAKATGDAIRALSEEIVTTSESKVAAHNTGTDTHSDIRLLIQGLTDRLNALADSDDTTLDQLSEVVAYIKSNRSLIEAITTSKVSVADIVDNLTTNVSNKPLSAAQGVVIKTLIDALRNDKLDAAELTNAVNTALAQAKASGEFDGAEGKSAYQYAQEGGYTGTETEFAAKLAAEIPTDSHINELIDTRLGVIENGAY